MAGSLHRKPPAGTLLKLGLRPEALSIVTEADGQFSGCVTLRENLGSEIFLHLDVDGVDSRVIVRADVDRDIGIAPGQQVNVRVRSDKALVFDESGSRVEVALGAEA